MNSLKYIPSFFPNPTEMALESIHKNSFARPVGNRVHNLYHPLGSPVGTIDAGSIKDIMGQTVARLDTNSSRVLGLDGSTIGSVDGNKLSIVAGKQFNIDSF